jgi:serine/threonine protein kinase
VESKISEGGYAFVYRVTDLNSLSVHALKRIYVPNSLNKLQVDQEIALWKQITDHENIVTLIDAQYSKEGSSLYMMILCELCEKGTIFDLLNKYEGKLSEQ